MTNLNESEKSRGVVIFAKNSDTIDYETIAARSARLIKHFLKLPVTIITDVKESTNRRYNIDTGEFETWHNQGRYRAYELSPYDQTLLLDCDYLVLDDSLLKILDTLEDYKIVRHNSYLNSQPVPPMGKYSLDHLWATVVAFDRSSKSKMLFDLVGRIERNYSYYRRLYNIEATNYRNDYAFTIADLILNGYSQDPKNYIPWPMLSITYLIDHMEIQGNKLIIRTPKQAYVLPKQNIHVMRKSWLVSNDCDNFIQGIVNA